MERRLIREKPFSFCNGPGSGVQVGKGKNIAKAESSIRRDVHAEKLGGIGRVSTVAVHVQYTERPDLFVEVRKIQVAQ
jgi:hypothetical protein